MYSKNELDHVLFEETHELHNLIYCCCSFLHRMIWWQQTCPLKHNFIGSVWLAMCHYAAGELCPCHITSSEHWNILFFSNILSLLRRKKPTRVELHPSGYNHSIFSCFVLSVWCEIMTLLVFRISFSCKCMRILYREGERRFQQSVACIFRYHPSSGLCDN